MSAGADKLLAGVTFRYIIFRSICFEKREYIFQAARAEPVWYILYLEGYVAVNQRHHLGAVDAESHNLSNPASFRIICHIPHNFA